MSEDNIRLIREGYEAVNSGDLDWFRTHVHPELEFRSRFSGLAGRVYRGIDAFEEWSADASETWEWWEQIPQRFIELDDERTIAEVRFKGRGKGSGVEIEQVFAILAVRREGKMWRLQAYDSVEQALEAAGASG